jgi:hypothetical protein
MRGRSFERRNHGDAALDGDNGDAQAEVGALLPLLQGGELLDLEEIRVRVERAQHLADRRGDRFGRVDLLGVLRLDGGEDLGVALEVHGSAIGGGLGFAAEHSSEPRGNRDQSQACDGRAD